MFKTVLFFTMNVLFTTSLFANTSPFDDYLIKPAIKIQIGKKKIESRPAIAIGAQNFDVQPLFGIRNVGNGHGTTSLGIRNVGNGGGLAEMRIIYLHQNLDRFLQICLTKQNVCNLSSQTLTEWEKLVANHQKDSQYYIVGFAAKVGDTKGYSLSNQNLTLSSQMLYSDSETPKKFGELLAYIIAVRLDLEGSSNSFAANLQIATDVFKKMNVVESSYRATGLPSLLRLAQLKAFDGISTHFMFSLEDKEKSIDLTEKLATSLPCGELGNWGFSQWSSSVTRAEGYFYGMAQGSCDGNSISQKIVIHFDIDAEWKLNFNKIDINFFEN